MSPISTKLGQDIPRHIWERYGKGFYVGASYTMESNGSKFELFILLLRFQWKLLIKVKNSHHISPCREKSGEKWGLPFCVRIWHISGYILSISMRVANRGNFFPATLSAFLALNTVTTRSGPIFFQGLWSCNTHQNSPFSILNSEI